MEVPFTQQELLDQRQRQIVAHARDRHQPARDRVFLRPPSNLTVEHHDLIVQRPQRLHHHLQGGAGRFRQIVTNLMGNAMRFTPNDSPIELAVAVDREGGYGSISIVDHGEGIPPQLREKIFQRFWRADTSRTRETGGSGLGLAIVAGIVAQHNGHVEAFETPGGGATFRVSIPLLPSEPAADSSPDEAKTPDASGARS